jgi:hypothetical protein
MSKPVCDCGEPAENICAKCKKPLCDEASCGMETVDGYLCGEYTQWGCGRKYTNCDECQEDTCRYEGDMQCCEDCGSIMCDTCGEEHDCITEEKTE